MTGIQDLSIRRYHVPHLFFLSLMLIWNSLLFAQDQESLLPTAAELERYPWYETIVLEGRVINDPLFTTDGGMILISDDRRIQRIDARAQGPAPRWNLRLPRLSAGEWFISSGAGVLIPAPGGRMWSVDIRRGRVLDRSIRYPFGDEGTVLFRDIVRGRIVEVRSADRGAAVHLYRWNPSEEGRGKMLLRWEVSGSQEGLRSIHLHDGRIFIFQTADALRWFSLDGAELAQSDLARGQSDGRYSQWDELFRMGDLYFLNNLEGGRYRIYDSTGALLTEAEKPAGSPVLMSWKIISGAEGGNFTVSHSSGGLYAETGRGSRRLFFSLEEQWRFLRFFYHDGYLYAADNGWRIHRFHIREMAQELYGADIRPTAPGSTGTPQEGAFLSELLVAALDFPDRFDAQITSISRAVENGELRGRLENYSSALDGTIRAVYGSAAAGSPSNTLPGSAENRRQLAAAVLLLGDSGMISRLINALQYEFHPRVLFELVERGGELLPMQKLELIALLRAYIADAQPWQRSGELMAGFAEFLLHELEQNSPGGGEESVVAQEAFPALNAVYPYLDNVQLRRRILGQSP
ncbi:hypothetical protein [Salinispira pacifica]|uniref:Uncharacterized protein n=1 Tax=Salinispira pacifica TaxID=1307761 RepID=V5WG83_9SPIO|nr:hypothetical protein [Salinispira pacifica]AHC14803.1 hypothetical protein L21SP2_1404 [Salinispira pacifica]